jgi:FeS assembly SUF system protein
MTTDAPDREAAETLDAAQPNAPAVNANLVSALPPEELNRLTADIISALKSVYDPEIPADIYELGLIYKVDIEDDRTVKIVMTLTAPACPVAGEMPLWVKNAVAAVEGVMDVEVEMTFDPPWTAERMSEEAQVALGWY